MEFIFRNPFVTKRSKRDGADIMHCAEILADSATLCQERGDTESYARLCIQISMLMNEAAKCYGFRNIADFDKWVKSGRKL